jgi:hypothetical protein
MVNIVAKVIPRKRRWHRAFVATLFTLHDFYRERLVHPPTFHSVPEVVAQIHRVGIFAIFFAVRSPMLLIMFFAEFLAFIRPCSRRLASFYIAGIRCDFNFRVVKIGWRYISNSMDMLTLRIGAGDFVGITILFCHE